MINEEEFEIEYKKHFEDQILLSLRNVFIKLLKDYIITKDNKSTNVMIYKDYNYNK